MGWYDLPTLLRFRKEVLSLDSAFYLTHGNPLGASSLLAYLNPSQGVYTGVCGNGKANPPLFGQIRYTMGTRSARLVFVMPIDRLNAITLPNLLEHLTVQAGEWGAIHILAEVDGQTAAFEGLRRAGFATYTWQRVGKFERAPNHVHHDTPPYEWRLASEADGMGFRSLYQSMVPAMVQPMENLLDKRLQGLACHQSGELIAYADLSYGPRGICVQPYTHPDVEDIPLLIASLVNSIPLQAGRPVYLLVRSYQGWLETALEDLNVEVSPRQALMAKHLVVPTRAAQAIRLPVLENGHAEPSAPIAQVDIHKPNGDVEKLLV